MTAFINSQLLLPIFLDLMMDNPQIEWLAPNYPVVE